MFTLRRGVLLQVLVALGCQSPGPSGAGVAAVEASAPASMPRTLSGVVEGHGAEARLDLLGRGPQEARAFLRVSRGAGPGRLYDGFYFARVRYDASSGRIEGTNDRCTMRGTAASLLVTCGERKIAIKMDDAVRGPAASAVGKYAGTCGGVKQHAAVSATWEHEAYLLTLMRAPEGARLADMLTARADATASDRVTFKHASKPSTCELRGAQLVCDACTMARLADTEDETRPAARTATADDDEGETATLPASGQFYGHLVHDGSGRSQLVAVNFNAGEDSVLANLDTTLVTKDGPVVLQYFGAGDSSDFVAFRSAPQTGAVLESDGDAVLALDRKDEETIGGVWYSKAFGRVGRFSLTRGLVPDLPEGATQVPQLSGFYRAGAWTLELAAVAGDATAAPARGMRLPLFGHVHDSQPASRRRAIVAGAYDPVSGQVSLRLDDGRVIAGHAEASALVLHWVPWASMDGFGSAGGVLRFERSSVLPPGRSAQNRN